MSYTFKRILIAVDGEPVAAHAAEIGIQLARSLGAALAFVHAVDRAFTYAPGITPETLIAEAERDAREVIAGYRSLSAGLSALEFIHVGKPADEILKTAKTWPADVIVIGSHGRHGLSRVLLGSVAEAVMRHAPCPVLVVRAKAE